MNFKLSVLGRPRGRRNGVRSSAKVRFWLYNPASRRRQRLEAVAPLTVGRGPEADIQVADHLASRVHCVIEWLDEALVVRDLSSRNGTYVNGRRVEQKQLKPGDVLSVGLTRLELL